MSLKIIKKDLFCAPERFCLAHCVSADFAMGAGIAKTFKERYGGVSELKSMKKGIGDVAVLERHSRIIFCLITKEKYNQKPLISDLKSCLEKLLVEMKDRQLTHLAIPKIGCGLDRLDWLDVSKLINSVFKGSDIVVRIYYKPLLF
jgi:O-acetyl-ADP-ribose deacetylase (regulator of RNase III)